MIVKRCDQGGDASAPSGWHVGTAAAGRAYARAVRQAETGRTNRIGARLRPLGRGEGCSAIGSPPVCSEGKRGRPTKLTHLRLPGCSKDCPSSRRRPPSCLGDRGSQAGGTPAERRACMPGPASSMSVRALIREVAAVAQTVATHRLPTGPLACRPPLARPWKLAVAQVARERGLLALRRTWHRRSSRDP